MRYRYESLTYVQGLAESDPPEVQIYHDDERTTIAILTSTPDSHSEMIDQSASLAYGLLTSLFAPTADGTLPDRLTKMIMERRAERSEKYKAGLFLFFRAEGDIEPATFGTQRDTGDFIVAIDSEIKEEIRERYRTVVRKILSALAMAVETVRAFQPAGDAVVLYDNSGKPIFPFHFQGGRAEAFISRRVTADELLTAQRLATELIGDPDIERVSRLINESLSPDQDRMRRFLSAWMALEVFVNKTFDSYSRRFWQALSNRLTPTVQQRYLGRIHEVMKDKYRLSDRFVLIATELDAANTDSNIKIFESAKKIRDRFAHGDALRDEDLPLEATQALARQLVREHVRR